MSTENPPSTELSSAKTGPKRSYLPLTIALIVFVLLFLTVLGANFVASYAVERDSLAINLAGRQRMLSQRITKSLLQLDAAVKGGTDANARPEPAAPKLSLPQDDLILSTELFDTTLAAFANGGTIKNARLELVPLPAVTRPASIGFVKEAQELWAPLKERIAPLIAVRGNVAAEFTTPALNYAADKNLRILDVMNKLTNDLETGSFGLAANLRVLAGVAAALALAVLAFTLYQIFGRLRQGDLELAASVEQVASANSELQNTAANLVSAKQDTDLIFSTVRQGMFLVDPKFLIGAQYSEEMKRLFRLDDLAGMNFLHLLQRLLPEKMFNTTRDYLELMLDPTKKEKQLAKINPLSQVEVNFPNPEGGFTTNFFEFSFRRIVQDKRVDRLFVGVRDITPQVQLEQRLRSEEAKKERQFEILLSILHVDPAALGEFLQLARQELNDVNEAFKMEDLARAGGAASPLSDAALREKLKGVFASIHNVKGNAAVLKLEHFEKSAHEFEEEVRVLLNRPRLAGEDLLAVVVRQSEFRSALDEAQELAGRIRGLVRAPLAPGAAAAVSVDPIAEGVTSLVGATALKLGKKVRVDTTGFSSADIPAEHRGVVKDLLIQLTRNAVVHGIEAPALRTAAGKPAEATIRLSGWMNGASQGSGHAFHLHVQDDGRGLDYRRIKERAVSLGLVTPAQVQSLSDEESTGFIFASGFSTADATTTDAGRGAGLDFVKRRVIDDLGGEIDVACDPGKSLLFTIVLPTAPTTAATA